VIVYKIRETGARMSIKIAVLAWAAITGSIVAHSQDDTKTSMSPTNEQPVAAVCELHIWPSSGLRSVFHGWVHGGIVDGAVNGRDGYPKIPADPINTEKQIELISAAPVPAILKLPDYNVIVHKTALDSRTARNTPGRIEPASPACYAELVFDDVFLQQDSFSGNHLKTFFRYKLFDGDTITRSFGAFTQSNLKVFPPQSASENEAALKDLDTAFRSNIEQFGGFLNKPVAKKKEK
jgi:hypothetical protein